MIDRNVLSCALAALLFSATLIAAPGKDVADDLSLPSPTGASVNVDGEPVAYTLEFTELEVADADGEPGARLVGMSYLAQDDAAAQQRPVTFVFNGGPIAASLYLHMGFVGPVRAVMPGQPSSDSDGVELEANGDTLLNVSDLVFVDPAGTGFSRTVPGKEPRDYFSVADDAQQVTAFISAWLDRHGRRDAPVFVMGESYGTQRAPEVGRQLAELERPVFLEGLILFGQAANIIEYAQRPDNIISYVASLPTLSAIAWYHDRAARKGRDFGQFLADARSFAATTYLDALFRGNELGGEELSRVAAKLEEFSGIPASYYRQHRLKISKRQFRLELLRDRGLIIGQSDGRYKAPVTDAGLAFDPSGAINTAYETAFRRYLGQRLGVGPVDRYRPVADVGGLAGWDWGGSSPFSFWAYEQPVEAMFERNARFRVYVGAGHHDLKTTTGGSDYLVQQEDWPRDRVMVRYYPGGHMAYIIPDTRQRLAQDLRRFIRGEW